MGNQSSKRDERVKQIMKHFSYLADPYFPYLTNLVVFITVKNSSPVKNTIMVLEKLKIFIEELFCLYSGIYCYKIIFLINLDYFLPNLSSF